MKYMMLLTIICACFTKTVCMDTEKQEKIHFIQTQFRAASTDQDIICAATTIPQVRDQATECAELLQNCRNISAETLESSGIKLIQGIAQQHNWCNKVAVEKGAQMLVSWNRYKESMNPPRPCY